MSITRISDEDRRKLNMMYAFDRAFDAIIAVAERAETSDWHERNMREREIQHEMAQAADDDRRQNDG